MTTQTIPARRDVPVEHTWDVESMFATPAAWDAELESVAADLPALARFRGRLGDSAAMLADWFDASEAVQIRLGKLFTYASMNQAVDANDQTAAARLDRARGMMARAGAAMAFAEPELLQIGFEKLGQWRQSEPRLAIYAQYFDRLSRRAVHVRSAEVEELLSQSMDPFGAMTATHGILANAELRFEPARGSGGEGYEVAQGTINYLLAHTDREVRRTAFEHYADAHLALKSTMASCIAAGVKRDVFVMRAREYGSSLDAALGPNFIPTEVFHNLIAVFRKHLPVWHRYWRARRKALGLEKLHLYDTRAQLARSQTHLSFGQAVEMIAQGMRPLGSEYVSVMRDGVLEQRWVDIYPNKGKRMGAFSTGSYGTHPYIFMSFNDDIFSMSTLAHELGHSMHSYYTRKTQPFVYSRYGLFVAEVASNFNQAMVRAHLLNSGGDPAFQIAVIEEAMANFYRYFFIMPSLARFELAVHEKAERGEALTADSMIGLMADLLGEVYGDEVVSDRERSGITWAEFHTHLYSNFYVYQYATGIAGAHALAARVLSGGQPAADAYLAFLKAGGALYPLDALKLAGVDLSSPEPVEQAFATMERYVARLEELTQ
ncbi:MAG: oligoendopeptidase F [Chloroflexi bacterium]|nr:oligoendopeptidase F [Chloroflexota bacterium]